MIKNYYLACILGMLSLSNSCRDKINEPQEANAELKIEATVIEPAFKPYKELSFDAKCQSVVKNITESEQRTYQVPASYKKRLVLEVYKIEGNSSDKGKLFERMVLNYDKASNKASSPLDKKLMDGKYKVLAWADYVDSNNEELAYSSASLNKIIAKNKGFESIEAKKCAAGYENFSISQKISPKGLPIINGKAIESNTIAIKMATPLSRYSLVATDYQDYLKENGKLEGMKVKVTYKKNVKGEFDVSSNTASGVLNESLEIALNQKNIIEGKELILLSDYLLKTGTAEEEITIDVSLLNSENQVVKTFEDIKFPIKVNSETVVKAPFFLKKEKQTEPGNIPQPIDKTQSTPVRVYSSKYRIPSLIVTPGGRIIAAADRRMQGLNDWNNIDLVVKCSEDYGNTFDQELTIIDLVDSKKNEKSAFLIDPEMIYTKSGKLFLLVDMFPKSRGFFTVMQANPGCGYKKVGNEYYRILYKYGETNEYYVKPDGTVLDNKMKPAQHNGQTLTVKVKANIPFKELGDIHAGITRIGNIFRGRVNGESNNLEDCDGDYIINCTAYLWLTSSDDQGKTWSQPVDITPQVKKDYMRFMGTGPGVGIELKHEKHKGRLVFPVYYTLGERSQQSAVIYSDDQGRTWNIGESVMENRIVTIPSKGTPLTLTDHTAKLGGFQLTEAQVIELNNGDLKMFMRGYYQSIEKRGGAIHVATSHDGGKTWENKTEELPFEAAYCQLSVLKYDNIDGEEIVVVSATSNRNRRENGKLHLAKVKANGSFEWVSEYLYHQGDMAYSSIAKLPNNNIAILYESSHHGDIDFTRVPLSLLLKKK